LLLMLLRHASAKHIGENIRERKTLRWSLLMMLLLFIDRSRCVIHQPPLLVRQNLVRLLNLLELFWIAALVRMMLPRKLAVSRPDLIRRGVFPNTQTVVEP
jgi:hypothetical protein